MKERPKIYYIGVPETGNMGDHALVISSVNFIKKAIPKVKIIKMPSKTWLLQRDKIKQAVKPQDIFVYNPGGNMGTQYIDEEFAREELILNFPNNPIISLPQTIYFVDDHEDYYKWFSFHLKEEMKYDKELKITTSKDEDIKIFHDVYASHKNLYVFAREEKSFEIMKSVIPECNLFLTPDMVMSFSYKQPKAQRNQVLMSLRSDCEGLLNEQQKQDIKVALQLKFDGVPIKELDTNLPFKVKNENADAMLTNMLNEFASSKLVVTDRLHGMIFAAITNTPCIVLSNYNHKVKETYKWIKDLKFIQMVDDVNQVEGWINEWPYEMNKSFSNLKLNKKFKNLNKLLKKIYREQKRK
ncbi:MAG: polysaccharide pyruvyl transferase family protein [Clostridia bacterium]|nr:polysaccharide pyruvyl transferase family protein [Clostridia bacterium]